MFEYLIAELRADMAPDWLKEHLDGYGRDGWELCAVLPPQGDDEMHVGSHRPAHRFLFKRDTGIGRKHYPMETNHERP